MGIDAFEDRAIALLLDETLLSLPSCAKRQLAGRPDTVVPWRYE
jgi:hypothetical protein